MGDILKMSSKERRSLIELFRVKDGQQTLIEAAERLEFTIVMFDELTRGSNKKENRG